MYKLTTLAINGYRTTANRIFSQNNPQSNTRTQPQASTSTSTNSRPTSSNTDGNHRSAPAAARLAWISQEEFDQRRAKGACTLCGEMGHFSRQCPQRQNSASGRATFSDNSNETSGSIMLEVEDDVIDIDSSLFEEGTQGEEYESQDQGNSSKAQDE